MDVKSAAIDESVDDLQEWGE